jgi:hypothetical protein
MTEPPHGRQVARQLANLSTERIVSLYESATGTTERPER